MEFWGTLRNQETFGFWTRLFKSSKASHTTQSTLDWSLMRIVWSWEVVKGGCLGIWSSFLESLKLNKHPLKQSDNFNLFLFCLALSRAPPRHCLLKVPMALFPVPFLFLYIPARCVFGPLPSHSWWWAFCFFWRRTSKGKRLICAFPPLCGSCHKKPELSAAGSQQR